MSAAKTVLFGNASLSKIKVGIDTVANAVKETMGPNGRNVVIERAWGSPTITKDGVTVAKEIDLQDPEENLGATLVKDAASKTGDEAGDGTTTCTVLTQAIFSEGYKLLAAGAKPVDMKRGIDKVVKALVAQLRVAAKPISTKEEVAQVGSISANNEMELGALIADAMDKVGKNGVITISESSGEDTTLDIEDGFEFDRGWKDTSRYFLAQQSEGVEKLELTEPLILCLGKDLSSYADIMPVLEACTKEGKALLVVATAYSKIALDFLVYNCRKGVKVYAITAPGFGDNRDAYLEDIAIATGGHVFGVAGRNLPQLKTTDLLGGASKVIINKASTTILGGCGNPEEIQARISNLVEVVKNTSSDFDKEKIQERIGKLSGGVAVIRVGGNSEVELKEKRDRVEDALHATRAAIQGGVVPGGGVALLNAKKAVLALGVDYETEDQELGGNLVLRAVEAPIRCIVTNAGGKPDVVVGKILAGEELGYNAHTDTFEDLMVTGVIDPANVAISALINASSNAGMILTTSVSITVIRDNQPTSEPGLP